MVEWISKGLGERKTSAAILEELLQSLLAKDSQHEYGMDNMSSILITFKR